MAFRIGFIVLINLVFGCTILKDKQSIKKPPVIRKWKDTLFVNEYCKQIVDYDSGYIKSIRSIFSSLDSNKSVPQEQYIYFHKNGVVKSLLLVNDVIWDQRSEGLVSVYKKNYISLPLVENLRILF